MKARKDKVFGDARSLNQMVYPLPLRVRPFLKNSSTGKARNTFLEKVRRSQEHKQITGTLVTFMSGRRRLCKVQIVRKVFAAEVVQGKIVTQR